MAEQATIATPPPTSAGFFTPVAHLWQRISPSLVPVLAVLTALIITVPFMIVTGGQGDFGRGLNIAGTAYSALVEGSLGLVVNDMLSPDNLAQVELLAAKGLTKADLRSVARDVGDLASAPNPADVSRWAALYSRYSSLTDQQIDDLGTRLPDIASIGVNTLTAMKPLVDDLAGQDRTTVTDLARSASLSSLNRADRDKLNALSTVAANLSDADLLAYIKIVNELGIVKLTRVEKQIDVLVQNNLDPASQDAKDFAAMAAVQGGSESARALAQTAQRLDAAGVTNVAVLSEQLNLTRTLYTQNILTNADVAQAIDQELPLAEQNNLLVRRPAPELLLLAKSPTPNGTIYDAKGVPQVVYQKLGGSVLMFFPANLETMIVRAIPFIIAGLAVALGFKAGLFNIGAEGQVYIGAIIATWVGYSPIFSGLPIGIRLPLVLVVGVLGGALWGSVPGLLRAFTGAHEVIVTIMLNYVAILLVDWLIKSTDPIIMLDPTASTPRTPFLAEASILPRFNTIPPWLIIAAGIVFGLLGLWTRRERIRSDIRFAVRPIINGVLVALGGLFLIWTSTQGKLHIGLLLMFAAVWFTDWFLNKTTLGFELRTVGANPDAARYAGMSVRRNIILALTLSGALAGLAGIIEITGVNFVMQPLFFSGLGFDAIAVALLARTNPRNMIAAGMLWGALLAGAGLMQVRADISIDLVKIIQALIIMFIAADAIIRYVWRVPKPSEKAIATFSKGWGS